MKKTTITLWAFLILGSVPVALAQGTAFTYQGRLNDGANPANGIFDSRFSIFDAAGGGSQQGTTVTNAATAVSNGLFTVTLDFGNQFPGGGRWLEIGVRTNLGGAFTTLTPRQQLTPTPYAIQAANAGTAAVATSASSVAAGNIVGTLASAQLPASVVTNGASGINLVGTFSGNGSGLTGVPGTLPWQTVPGVSVSAVANRGYFLSNDALTTVALPTSANVSDIIAVSGAGSNGWRVITTYVSPALPLWAQQNSGSQSWRSVASSADGNKLVAVVSGGQIYTSADTGVTWTPQTNGIPNNGVAFWNGVASSADGSKLAAVVFGGQIYTSTNSGATWSAQSSPTANWFAVASSADGSKLVAAVYFGNLYTSTNSGASWTAQTNSGSFGWQSVASSADGNQLVAGVYQGRIYISTNSGVNWMIQTNGIPQSGWKSVSCSADGTKLAAVSSGAYIYTSTNAGASWFIRVSSGISYWNSIAASSDGAKLVAVSDPNGGAGTLVVSTDYGTSWTTGTNGAPNAGNVAWQAVATSTDGSKLVAVATGVPICTAGPQPVFFNGAVGTTTEFQYVGNGVWRALGAGANQIVGTISPAQLPAGLVTNGASGVNFTGTFNGDGAGVTNLNLSLNSDGAIRLIGNFALASSPGVGSLPFSVTAADVNGDGKVDLISANNSANTLSVLTNNGSGGFGLASSPGVGANVQWVVSADVNGDGWVDLITANNDAVGFPVMSTLSVLTNNGSGGFILSSSPSVKLGPRSVTAADVNGDGKVDLISTAFLVNRITVLTNNGSGGFALDSAPDVGAGPITVTAADINGDGKVDLISANYGASTLSVLTNNGSGGFALASSPAVGSGPYAVTTADVNGDGKVDLISANGNASTLSVLTNNVSGGFVLSSSPAVGAGPNSVVAADINGDGKVDLISANGSANTLSVLTNNGSGGFGLASSPGVGSGPNSVVAADVNADGKMDLISANASANTLSVLVNTPTFAGNFVGNGSALTSLNAGNVTSGTLSDARLSVNVSLLGASIESAEITDGTIVNADINAAAGIVDTKLATITTTGKVADSALSGNVALRSGSNTFTGNQSFTGGTINLDNAQAIYAKNTGGTPEVFLWPRYADNATYLNFGSGGFHIRNFLDVPVMSMRTNGNVGIGASTPNFPLTFSSALGDKISLFESGGGNHYGFGVQSFQLQIHTDTSAADIVFGSGQSTNLVETMRIKGSGNVGIGTANPNANTLQINTNFHPSSGYALTASKADFGANIQINRGAGQGGIGLVIDNSANGDASSSLLLVRNNVATNAQTQFTVKANGNIAIGSTTTTNDGILRMSCGNTLGFTRTWDIGVPYGGTNITSPFYDFVINDVNGGNRFLIDYNTGNVGIGTLDPTNKLHVAGGVSATAFVTTSDRNAKENFTPVSPQEVLNKVATLPITTWNFKTMKDGRHMGPMAQDFYAAFGLGGADTTITSMDPDGVALAAIQGLNQKLEETRVELKRRDAENAELRQRMERLEKALLEKSTRRQN